MQYKYYLLETVSCTGEGAEDDIAEDVGVKSFFKAGRLLPLDSFSLTHGPSTKLFGEYSWILLLTDHWSYHHGSRSIVVPK